MDSSECRPWGSSGLSAPLSLCRSHMIRALSQNSVTLTGLPMILLSESDLTYPLCVVSCHLLLGVRRGFSLKNGTTLHVGLCLEYLYVVILSVCVVVWVRGCPTLKKLLVVNFEML